MCRLSEKELEKARDRMKHAENRIDKIIKSMRKGLDMTNNDHIDYKHFIFKIVSGRIGKQFAITSTEIAKMLNKHFVESTYRITPSDVRRLIKELIEEDGKIILASCANNSKGYFVPSSDYEIEEYKQVLISRIRSINDRLKAIDQALHRKIDKVIQKELFEMVV